MQRVRPWDVSEQTRFLSGSGGVTTHQRRRSGVICRVKAGSPRKPRIQRVWGAGEGQPIPAQTSLKTTTNQACPRRVVKRRATLASRAGLPSRSLLTVDRELRQTAPMKTNRAEESNAETQEMEF